MKGRGRYITIMLWASAVAFLLFGGAAMASPFVSPVGTWDFSVSGSKKGSANITFNGDGTITGYMIVIPASNCKGGTDGIDEFGFFNFSGLWDFNDSGQVVGFMCNAPTETVRLDIPSFWGTVSSNGNTFSIKAQNEDGNLSFAGVRLQQLAFLPPVVVIDKKMLKKTIFTEMFAVQTDVAGYGNLYDLSGLGADLCVSGVALLSKSNTLNIAIWEYPMPDSGNCSDVDVNSYVGSAVTGRLNMKTGAGTLTGAQQGTRSAKTKVVMPVIFQ